MKIKQSIIILSVVLIFIVPGLLSAHCQIPCGIYGDSLRIDLMKEHTRTIEKSMNTITELKNSDDINYNQLVRWVVNKEEHANKFAEIVTFYFMDQRIKPAPPEEKEAYEKYQNQIELLHRMRVYAMKAKQTTDTENVKKLRELIKKFADSYFHEH